MIPPITHPLGRYWDQPDPSRIRVDETHAVMNRKTFAELCEYSCSMPSGVYEGKMWRRHDGAFDRRSSAPPPRWLLCWYGPSRRGNPDECSINFREILLVDAEAA